MVTACIIIPNNYINYTNATLCFAINYITYSYVATHKFKLLAIL